MCHDESGSNQLTPGLSRRRQVFAEGEPGAVAAEEEKGTFHAEAAGGSVEVLGRQGPP